MGWVESQIEERRESDQKLLEDSLIQAAGAVMGQRQALSFSDMRIVTRTAVDEVLKYYHEKPAEISPEKTGETEDLDLYLRPYGFMHRSVILNEGWYKDAWGPLLGRMKADGRLTALIPGRFGGYYYTDPLSGKKVRITKKTAADFKEEAECFYRPLPKKALGIPDLLIYMKRCISFSDIVMIIAVTVVCTLVGMIMPRLTKILTGSVLGSGQISALSGIAVAIFSVAVTSQLLSTARSLLMSRLQTKTGISTDSAVMMRLMSMPASFFRSYSAGELKSRFMSVNNLCSALLGMVMSTSLTALSSLLYVTQIFQFAPTLVIPSLIIVFVTITFSTVSSLAQIGINKKKMELSARESGMSYAMITGIQKIRLSGSEKRIFAKWLSLFSENAQLSFNPPLFLRINPVISSAITLISNIVLYFLALKAELTPSSYFAFMAAYGALMGAFITLSSTALSAAQIRPVLEMAEPFLKTVPENTGDKEIVTDISGALELEHVSFRYDEKSPWVLDDLSIRIKAGEYVAVVGKTGCGKSTLMRLLLGFETPQKGAVFYDRKNLDSLDLSTLRRKIGTVMQNSSLFSGDIYSNIVITDPSLDVDAAWEAAEKADIAEDIRRMPMGMFTYVSEGSGGISGGQKQRLMIARAIAAKPKILLFDEATSALDNLTQKKVTAALDEMKCTRLIIAHRLSTIRHCDRILVLDHGKIIEDGTYEELIQKNGFFAQLVERQRLNENE